MASYVKTAPFPAHARHCPQGERRPPGGGSNTSISTDAACAGRWEGSGGEGGGTLVVHAADEVEGVVGEEPLVVQRVAQQLRHSGAAHGLVVAVLVHHLPRGEQLLQRLEVGLEARGGNHALGVAANAGEGRKRGKGGSATSRHTLCSRRRRGNGNTMHKNLPYPSEIGCTQNYDRPTTDGSIACMQPLFEADITGLYGCVGGHVSGSL